MPRSMKSMVVGASMIGAAGFVALMAPGAIAQNSNAVTVYRASLSPLPNTSGQGMATLRLSADQRTLTVNIMASGLEAGGDHMSHIHGLSSTGGAPIDSTCPTAAQDSDGDTFVELAEGQMTYGPILIDFMNIDPDRDGTINFTTTLTLNGSENVLPLSDRHIVIHGMTVAPGIGAGTPGEVDGTNGYLSLLPVLCGEIRKVGGGRDPMQFTRAPGGK